MRTNVKSGRHARKVQELVASAASNGAQPLRRTYEAVEALGRIGAGTYGICRDCDGRIPTARLRAKPEATRCIRCQLEFEDGRAA
jgi:RNA polymerase-binding transcription factor DksA